MRQDLNNHLSDRGDGVAEWVGWVEWSGVECIASMEWVEREEWGGWNRMNV